ncbi:MAG: AtpZ/AtpI family protein [Candidatus Midichloria sp.]|nr:MAG: AtpZ/AtpI family protein [Candidatus Midichloria sp.]
MDEIEKKISSLRQRLFRPQKPKKTFSGYNLVLELASGVAVGAFLGYHADKYMDTSPIFLFLGSIFGIATGSYNAYNAFKGR